MKRKHLKRRKMTTAQLLEAGHTKLAAVLRVRLAVSIQGRPKFEYRREMRQKGRSFIKPEAVNGQNKNTCSLISIN